MFKLTLIKADQSRRYNITPITGSITWETDFTLLASLEFDIAYSDTRYPVPTNPVDVGDHVLLTHGKNELFRGVIVIEPRKGRNPIKYTAYDYTWYLGQSKTVYQFNNIPASQAITQVLTDFGISIGHIINMPTRIDHIYIEEVPAVILNEIIHKVEASEGYKINGEMRQGKLYLDKHEDLVITGKFKIADNVQEYDVLHSISEPTRTRSIEQMRNRVRLIIEDEEVEYIETALVEDTALINRYGLLEETIKMDIEDTAKARQAARVLLERMGRVHEQNSVKLMGDIRFKAGRLFYVEEPITGINGQFVISSAKHTISNNIHTMDLDLELPQNIG